MLHQPGMDHVDTFDVEPVNAPSRQQSQPLYAKREKIHPKRARGQFRRLKWIVMAITLGIYYVTPWIRWDRGPFAPDQAVLVDLANRRFYFFFIEIWPQEFIFVAGLLVMAGVGLFLVTSVVGRAWCGYTCPQTVWTDLFLVVERFFEGDRNARIKLDKAPWSFDKIRKRVMKHASWLVIAVATGGAWIFYFADAPTLLLNFLSGQAPFVAYATVGILTATTYVFGGFMREQVCIYMCPWPRIQAAMLDEDSLVVTYNDWRGEPRSHGAKKAAAAGLSVGDCVDCNACVAVCPMGIDIRDGQQLACITCALCIDACDGVMDKLGRERGLISYATLSDYNANMAIATDPATGAIEPERVRDDTGQFMPKLKHFDWHIFLRPRTLIYAGIWVAIGIGLLVALPGARPAGGQRPARPQPGLRDALRRLDPQRLHGQAPQHDPRAAADHPVDRRVCRARRWRSTSSISLRGALRDPGASGQAAHAEGLRHPAGECGEARHDRLPLRRRRLPVLRDRHLRRGLRSTGESSMIARMMGTTPSSPAGTCWAVMVLFFGTDHRGEPHDGLFRREPPGAASSSRTATSRASASTATRRR